MDKVSGIMPFGGFYNPHLYDMANIKSDALNDRIHHDRFVPGHGRHMKVGFEFGTKKVILDLWDRLEGLHLECHHL